MAKKAAASPRRVVFVDGCRIPFLRSGTDYKDLLAYDLARFALRGLLDRNNLDPAQVDRVIMGTVIQEVKTSNIAREAALGAGFPLNVPANTVTMACISSNQAITSGVESILSGKSDIVVAGGVETMSDVPIRFKKKVRQKLIEAQKFKSPLQFLGLLKGLKLSDLAPEAPSISEFSTGETMGQSADKLAAMFSVTRQEQDEFALKSHLSAAKAAADGHLAKEIVPVVTAPKFKPVTEDNGVRGDSTLQKLSSLRPAFSKPYGTVTAGNASFLTDGASACLLMSEEKALELGFKPKAFIGAYAYVAQDPGEELLLGPAYAIPRVLDEAGLSLADIGVVELHEAFAGQVLAIVKALESESFARKIGKTSPIGSISMEKLNNWGGSLSIGHPFGATGVRILTTTVNRLHHENQEYGMLSACAAGGQGHAMIVQRYA